MKTIFNSLSIMAGLIVMILILSTSTLFADFSGRALRTLKTNTKGCDCHGVQSSVTNVVITGPDSLTPNMQTTYSVTISGGPLGAAGVDIAASSGTLAAISSDLKLSGVELVHSSPKLPTAGSVVFQFKYTAPAVLGAQTLYATGNSVDNTGDETGDEWRFAPNKIITVVATLPVELTSFTAAALNGSVKLTWTTATELNNFGFRVERKDNNSTWKDISFVHGAGTSVVLNKYSYTDKNVSGKNQYTYRLSQVDNNGTTTSSKEIEINTNFIPVDFSVDQNYPNPFNPSTTIKYSMPVNAFVTLKVYNAIGKEVAVLVNELQSADLHSVNFDASKFSSGIYYYTIKAGNDFTQTKKMILIK